MKKGKRHYKCHFWKKLMRGQWIGSNFRGQVGKWGSRSLEVYSRYVIASLILVWIFILFRFLFFVFWDKISYSPKLSSSSWKLRLALNSLAFLQPLPPSAGITAMHCHRWPQTHNSLGKDNPKQTRQNVKIYLWQIHGYSFYYFYSLLCLK